jgi:chemotaxis protein CheD
VTKVGQRCAVNVTKNPLKQPPLLSGFEHINRYWDDRLQVWSAKILPGELYVSTHGEMICTVLGSCISACIRDQTLGIGGMNHFMLPVQGDHRVQWGDSEVTGATRYGNWAMEYLINHLIKLGAKKERMEVKLFGGGQVLANLTDVGQRNIIFAYDFIRKEGLNVRNADVGDIFSRKVLYFSDTGSVKVKKMATGRNETIIRRERDYMKNIEKDVTKPGDVELF